MSASAYDTEIYNVAKQSGLSDTLARLITAQARLETADYTSNVFKRSNNAFGMKYVPTKYQSGSCGISSEFGVDRSTYGCYSSIENSARDLVAWLMRRQSDGRINVNSISTADQYAAALKSNGYYGSSTASYASGLLAKMSKLQIATAATGGLLLLASILFLIYKNYNK